MARKRERIFALVMALAFLITTVGVSVTVIWQIVQENKETKTATEAVETNKKKLEGTKMDNFTPVAKVDELQIIDTKEGTGQEVKAGDTIKFDYTGALAATGVIFQSSLDKGEPITYPLANLIPGWQEGIVGMKVGGERRLLIPAAKGYGSAEQPGIPANSDIVFDIVLHAIEK
ncbi:MAG: FKBP-type peptidyl-prolyl cis-trans isomerase [Patescibacteria group bacterium]